MQACRLFPRSCFRFLSSTHNHNKNGFGIVAAMTSNQVIGVNGSLPWKNLTQDRNHFVNLTKKKVLIVGRRTFCLEDASLAHIRHCRACIVVSQSINQDDLIAARVDNGSEHMVPELLLARSLEEALELARLEKRKRQRIEQHNNHNGNDDNEVIDCWVAGGEAIYKEALQHPDALEVRLTHVDMMVETNQFRNVAFFPLEDMNANGFDEVSTEVVGNCEFMTYRRKIRLPIDTIS